MPAESCVLRIHPTHAMVEAAARIHRRLDGWQTADRALRTLRERIPDFSLESTLLKVTAVNALYGANLYAIERMAKHIHSLSEDVDIPSADLDIVDRIAQLPVSTRAPKRRQFVSFASKFAHFFISEDRFPICDNVAEWMLRRHFRRGEVRLDQEDRYQSYVRVIDRLIFLADLQVSYTEIDHYLWLAGSYLKWRRGEMVGGELADYFSSESQNSSSDLKFLTAELEHE